MTSADPIITDGTKTIAGSVDATHVSYNDATVAGTGPSTVTGTLSTAGRNVSVSFDVGPELTTSHFVRVYRSKSSTGYNVPPNQDYYLVNEIAITPGIIAAGVYTFTDSTPDEVLLDPYYNNVNGDGEAPDGAPENENAVAPLCKDLTTWDDRLWGANLTERQSLTLNLLGVSDGPVYGSPNGLQVGDSVTVGGVTYTAVSAAIGAASATEFDLYTTAIYYMFTQTEAIYRTLLSLALTIAKHPSSSVTAAIRDFNVYNPTTLPGQMFLESYDPASSVFTFTTTRTTAWNPDPTAGLSSAADAATNGLWFSKQEQSEAVPRLNRLSIGPRNNIVRRIRGLGERLYVFTDKGIYTVSNTFPYRVDLLSKTALLVAPDTLADLDDALFALTSQGFARISDAGVGVISTPIESDVKRLFGEGLTNLQTLAQGVGYESYRKYIVTMPTTSGDTVNTQQLVYDVASKAWTKWDMPAACMIRVPETDFLYVASTTENRVSKERKNYNATDYSDESFSVTLSAASGKTLTLVSTTGITAGDMVYQSDLVRSLVTEVVDSTHVTVEDTLIWTPGLATSVYRGIHCRVIFSEHFAGVPNYLKHWSAVTFHFRSPGLSTATAVFSSELGPSEETVALSLQGWGQQPWGEFAWAQPDGPRNSRVFVTGNATRAAYLTVGLEMREAQGVWALYGYTPEVQVMGPRSSMS
jgi:hypothetical protein